MYKTILTLVILLLFVSFNFLFLAQPVEAQSYLCTCGGEPSGITFPSLIQCRQNCGNICGTGPAPNCEELGGSSTGCPDPQKPCLSDPLGNRPLSTVIGQAIGVALGVIGSIALVLFVYGGFVWMTAGGNANRVSKGRDILVWASIGLVVIFTSFAILSFILDALR